MARNPIWQADYNIRKVNGEPYIKDPEQFRGTEEDVRRMMMEGSKNLAERFDFALVEVTVKNLMNGDILHYKHETEGGFVNPPKD